MSKLIPLTQGKFAIVDDEFERLNRYKWYAIHDGNNWYASRSVDNRQLKMHHVIIGKPSKPLVVDHINRNGLDNRKGNLRITTVSKNGFNRKEFTLGVYRNKGGWVAMFKFKGKKVYLGRFKSFAEAREAYNQARKEFKIFRYE